MKKNLALLFACVAFAAVFLWTRPAATPAVNPSPPAAPPEAVVSPPVAPPAGVDAARVVSPIAEPRPPAHPGADPKWDKVPYGETVDKGVKWLVSTQGADGGWGQDGGEKSYVRNGEKLESEGNDVANTCLATLALVRTGNTVTQGAGKDALKNGLNFVLNRVEESPADGILLKTPTATQVQRKLGANIDTFVAAMLLSEVDGATGDAQTDTRVRKALEKVVGKIEKNQQKDGSWNTAGGWAPILGTSIASRSLYTAQGKGVAVAQNSLDQVDKWTKETLIAQANLGGSDGGAEYTGSLHTEGRVTYGRLAADAKPAAPADPEYAGRLSAAPVVALGGAAPAKAAPVAVRMAADKLRTAEDDLVSASASPGGGGMSGAGFGSGVGAGVGAEDRHDRIKSAEITKLVVRHGGSRAASSAGVKLYDRAQAIEQLSRTPEDRLANAPQLQQFAAELSQDAVVSGFGSMGGEEFFSYLNVSDSLHRVGGPEWDKWNTKIKDHVTKLQNADGTWAGQHCITGRVACTSAAVLTLLTERMPMDMPKKNEKF